MIDINLIRNDTERVQKALQKRIPDITFDEVLAWDEEKRKIGTERDKMKNQRNVISKKIPQMKKNGEDADTAIKEMKELGKTIAEYDQKYAELDEKITNFLAYLPNIPDDDVPAGGKENNEVVRTYGEKADFAFQPKDHVALAKELSLIDFERGVKIAGSGNWIYTGLGAQLEWALLNFFVAQHLQDNWEFMLLPHMLTRNCGFTAGQFPKFSDEVFWIHDGESTDNKFLLPTAETALVSVHYQEILSAEELPKKYFAFTPCYRKEAGSSRVEERGTIRGHQFNKVELVQYTTAEASEDALEELVQKAEDLVQQLGLHYQVSKLAANDCSAGMAKTYDIEVWIPSMQQYKEVSSASSSRDYQARRGSMKYFDAEGEKQFMHTLNASGLATSRLIPALLEQFQQADGSVLIPKPLQPYMNGLTKIVNKKAN